MREAKNLNKILLDAVCGSFLPYEKELKDDEEKDKQNALDKRKGFALKVDALEEGLNKLDVDSNYKDEDVAPVDRRFKQLFERRN